MKKLLIVVGAVIVLVILAMMIAPFFISVDTFKGQILARVEEATGRDMKIGGPLSIGLFPNVRVSAADVTLANAPGASSPTMAKLKKLELAVRLIPLLSGRFEVERLVLVDPQFDLEIDAQGRPSWSFAESGATLPAPAPGAVPPKNPSMMGLAALSRLQVKDVTIQNGTVTLLDRRSRQRDELQQVAVTLSAPNLDSPFTMDGSAVLRGEKIAFSARLDNTGALVRPSGKSGLTVSVTAKPITLKFTGGVTHPDSNEPLVFDGSANLAIPSVRDFIKWSGRDITLPKQGFGALALNGSVHAQRGVARFSNGNFALDTIKATGTLTLDIGNAKPTITGNLQTGMLDLNPYLPPPVRGWSTNPFDTTMLRQVDAELTVDALGAKFRNLQIGKANAAVHLKDGVAAVDLRQISLYRGDGKGKIKLDATGPSAAITIDGSVNGLDVGALMRDAGSGGGVSGSASFTLSGTARGNSERDLVSTLSGKSSFRMSNGSLGGVDLGGMLKNTSSAFGGGGGTAIQHASGSYTIRNGIMSNRDLSVSTSSVDATGAGTVNLPARTLDYRLTPKLVAGLVTVPVNVHGSWDHLSYEPDLAGIAKGIVQAPGRVIGGAAGGAGKLGEGVGTGVGGAIKGLFGN